MAEDTCVKRMVPDCGDSEQKGSSEGFCPDWDACMPFGGRLYSRDGCVQFEASATAPADGVYDRVTVQDGCIVGVSGKEVASYQPRPCTETPCDCGSGSGSGSEASISDDSGNLITEDLDGSLLAKLYATGAGGITVSGNGTQSSPLRIQAAAQTARGYVQAGNDGISVSGSGTQSSPYSVSHKAGTGPANQTIAGMRFDEYGHLKSYTAPTGAGTVNGVVGRNGIEATTDTSSGVVTLDLQETVQSVKGTYRLGGYDVDVDKYGRFQQIDREVSIAAGSRYFGAYLVALDALGNITDVTDTTQDRTVVYHKASKRFTGSSASITFTTALVGSFRVSLRAASVTSASVSIDGTAVTTDHGTDWAEALSGARYALGQHTVSVSGTFSGPGYLDVEIVTGY
jgi:hypothetical protein